MTTPHDTFEVRGAVAITLIQLMKLANRADSGGQAKAMVEDGLVRVNGEPEARKRRQMAHGDIVEVEGHPPLRLILADAPAPPA